MRLATKRFLLLTFFGLVLGLVISIFLYCTDLGKTLEFHNIRSRLADLLRERPVDAEALKRLFDEKSPFTLVCPPYSHEIAELFQPELSKADKGGRMVYDPLTTYRLKPRLCLPLRFPEHPLKTWDIVSNNLGFRNDEDVPEERPDYRVLITGDSHTEGVVPNRENYASVLAASLGKRHPASTIEAWNAGVGAYTFYNYLGVMEKYAYLEPDTFIMAVYGGNDFSDLIPYLAYFYGMPAVIGDADYAKAFQEAAKNHAGALAQEFGQAARFLRKPEESIPVLKAAKTATLEAAARCAEAGCRFLVLYIPSLSQVQPRFFPEKDKPVFELLGVEPGDIRVNDDLGDRYLQALKEAGIPYLDLRPPFKKASDPLYWATDLHINTLAHRLIAEELAALLDKDVKEE